MMKNKRGETMLHDEFYYNDLEVPISDSIYGVRCRNKITRALDEMCGISKLVKEHKDSFHHYILNDNLDSDNNVLPIRVPGGTVGCVYYDENHIITGIEVDTDYVIRTYCKDVNEQIKSFIGMKLVFVNKPRK